jgi:hypothetical protein
VFSTSQTAVALGISGALLMSVSYALGPEKPGVVRGYRQRS